MFAAGVLQTPGDTKTESQRGREAIPVENVSNSDYFKDNVSVWGLWPHEQRENDISGQSLSIVIIIWTLFYFNAQLLFMQWY